jgi:hypothetical protein
MHVTPLLFTSRLLERLELLSWTHHDAETRWDHQRYRDLAARCEVMSEDLRELSVERRTRRSARAVPLRGLIGKVDVAGVAPDLGALWKMAEVVQVGKQTVFGFGVVRVGRS